MYIPANNTIPPTKRMITCNAEDFVPIPTASGVDAVEMRKKAQAACMAALLLEREGYEGPQDDPTEMVHEVGAAVNNYAECKEMELNPMISTPQGAYFVQQVLSQYDMAVVKSATAIRNYVTNRLILETESPDPKIRLKSLELLGKISDVGLFTDRTEVTINDKSTNELTDLLKGKLRRLMETKDAQDAVYVTPPPTLNTPIVVDDFLK